MLATIFTIGLGISGYFAGALSDKTSRKTVMLIGIAVNSYLGFNVLTTETDQIAFAFFEGMFASGVARRS